MTNDTARQAWSADILVRSKLNRSLGQGIRRAVLVPGVAAEKNVRAPAFDCGVAALRPSCLGVLTSPPYLFAAPLAWIDSWFLVIRRHKTVP